MAGTESAFVHEVTPCDELDDFIDGLDDAAQPLLHATVDDLPDELLHTALQRMRFLRARITDPIAAENLPPSAQRYDRRRQHRGPAMAAVVDHSRRHAISRRLQVPT